MHKHRSAVLLEQHYACKTVTPGFSGADSDGTRHPHPLHSPFVDADQHDM